MFKKINLQFLQTFLISLRYLFVVILENIADGIKQRPTGQPKSWCLSQDHRQFDQVHSSSDDFNRRDKHAYDDKSKWDMFDLDAKVLNLATQVLISREKTTLTAVMGILTQNG